MKKSTILFALSALLLTGCGSKDKPSYTDENIPEEAIDNSDIEQTEEVSVDRTKEIKDDIQSLYDKVFAMYLSNKAPESGELARQYCTESYTELHRRAEKLANATGDLGPFGYDEWICAQDWGKDLSARVVAADMISDNEAVVNLIITNASNTSNARIIVKKEFGSWKIDDFQSKKDGKWNSLRKNMKRFVGD